MQTNDKQYCRNDKEIIFQLFAISLENCKTTPVGLWYSLLQTFLIVRFIRIIISVEHTVICFAIVLCYAMCTVFALILVAITSYLVAFFRNSNFFQHDGRKSHFKKEQFLVETK